MIAQYRPKLMVNGGDKIDCIVVETDFMMTPSFGKIIIKSIRLHG